MLKVLNEKMLQGVQNPSNISQDFGLVALAARKMDGALLETAAALFDGPCTDARCCFKR